MTEKYTVTDEQLGHLARKQRDLFERVEKGSVPVDYALDGLQLISENRLPIPTKQIQIAKRIDPRTHWERFYRHIFGRNYDFSGVSIPEAEDIFSWHVCIPGSMETEEAFGGGKKQNDFWKRTNKKLDDVLNLSFGRDAESGLYIVRFRPNVEADVDLMNLSANKIEEMKIKTATLKERLLLGRFIFWKQKKILDFKNWTLCSGSRNVDGSVPWVSWCPFVRRLEVDQSNSDSAESNQRARRVVTNLSKAA